MFRALGSEIRLGSSSRLKKDVRRKVLVAVVDAECAYTTICRIEIFLIEVFGSCEEYFIYPMP